MKQFVFFLTFFWLFLTPALAQFKTGESVTVYEPYKGDLYLAGATVEVNAPVHGDLVAAGGQISVGDSVYQDLLIAGGQVTVFGPVLDDIRCAGGEVTIRNTVKGDLLVAGGNILVNGNAIIEGNLIAFGGEIDVDGRVKGNIRSYGGEITLNGAVERDIDVKGGIISLNGTVDGSAEIAAEELTFGRDARISGDLNYWRDNGEMELPSSVVGGTTTFDRGLRFNKEENSWWLGGIAIVVGLLLIMAAFLLILILDLLFAKPLTRASKILTTRTGENLGIGFLYLIGVPVVIVILFALVIGIPIGLFLMTVYGFSLLFGFAVASLLFIHYLDERRGRHRNVFLTTLLALGMVVVLRVICFIPFIGWLLGLLILALTYGTLINHFVTRMRSKVPIA